MCVKKLERGYVVEYIYALRLDKTAALYCPGAFYGGLFC